MKPTYRLVLPPFVLSLLATGLQGQTRPPAAADDAAKDREAIVELSPFTVTTDKDVGYLAANTLAGSRLNTSLIDTPASISELTAEFLADINAINVNDAVEFSLGFQIERNGTNDNVTQYNSQISVARGLGRTSVSRDYFPWSLADDVFSIERLSESRGPNAILFGIGSAGGIINTTPKRALFRSVKTVGFRFDEHGGWRATLDYNRKLNDQLALRLNVVKDDLRSWRELEYTRDKRVHLASTWRPFRRTELRAEYEEGLQDRLLARRFSGMDYLSVWAAAGRPVFNRATTTTPPAGIVRVSGLPRLTYEDTARSWANYQFYGMSPNPNPPRAMINEAFLPFKAMIQGPRQTSNNAMHTFSLIAQQEIVKNLFVELGYNQNSNGREVMTPIDWNDQALKIDPNVTAPAGATAHTNQLYLEGCPRYDYSWGNSRNLRLLSSYEWDSRNRWLGSHRFVALATQQLSNSGGATFRESNLTPLLASVPALNNGQNMIWRRVYVSQNGVFGDNGVRYFNQDPFAGVDFRKGATVPSAAPVAFSDPVNGLTGTISPGFYQNDGNLQRVDVRSAMLAGQHRLLRNRLIVTWGLRKDEQTQQVKVVTRNTASALVTDVKLGPKAKFKGDTKTVGAVIPITSWLGIYANRADNFSPQSALDIAQENIGNVIGQGHDAGIKLNLSGNRLYFRVGAYKSAVTKQAQLLFSETTYIRQLWEVIEGPTGPHYLAIDQTNNAYDTIDTESTGKEFELLANPIKGLSLTANYATLMVQAANVAPIFQSYIAQHQAAWNAADPALPIPSLPGRSFAQARQLLNDAMTQRLAQNGSEKTNNYRYSFNFVGRYQFQGELLKGWTAGAGYRYRGGRIVNYTASRDKIWAPTYPLANVFIDYRRKLWNRKVDMTVRLNASNVLNNRDLVIAATDVTGAIVTAYTFQDPRLTTLSFDFAF